MEFADGRVSISANNPDLGEAVKDIESEYKVKLIVIGFKARYLIDVLAMLSGEGDIQSALRPSAA